MFRATPHLLFNAARGMTPVSLHALPDLGFIRGLNGPKSYELPVLIIKPTGVKPALLVPEAEVSVQPVTEIVPVAVEAKPVNALAELQDHPNSIMKEISLLRAITHGVPDPDTFSYRAAFWKAMTPSKGSAFDKLLFGNPDPQPWVWAWKKTASKTEVVANGGIEVVTKTDAGVVAVSSVGVEGAAKVLEREQVVVERRGMGKNVLEQGVVRVVEVVEKKRDIRLSV